MNNKIITGAVSAAVLSLSGMVYADTTSDLVNALVTKGVLTEEEGALLSKGHDKKIIRAISFFNFTIKLKVDIIFKHQSITGGIKPKVRYLKDK